MTKENTEIEKLNLNSMNVAVEKQNEILRLFPEIRTEGGKIDFEKLKLTLGELIDTGKERYGMNWPGKGECFKTIQTPSFGTLLPSKEESVNFDQTENLIIEGDNLETLKLLQKSYLSKIKMIYVDPPYNTGGDFIYPDNYTESLNTYLEYTGQIDSEGRKFGTNTDSEGRFHSKWMNMMFTRLFLAKNLLKEDGAIFISIDDNEIHNLRHICTEIFGEENFIATLVWEKGKKGDSKYISNNHEYVLIFAKNKSFLIDNKIKWRQKKQGVDEVLAKYSELKRAFKSDHARIRTEMMVWYKRLPDDQPAKSHKHYNWSDDRGLYFPDNFHGPDDGRESRPRYEIIHPASGKPCAKPSTGWRWEEERTKAALTENPPRIHFGPDETTIPCRKTYLEEVDSEPFPSVFYKDGRSATLRVEQLVGRGAFDFPKDHEVISSFIDLVCGKDDLILDFFAGSGTTADSVLRLNGLDGGSRKFILVQLPEPLGQAHKYHSIADITKQRVRAVIENSQPPNSRQMSLSSSEKEDKSLGFRVFKLSESNFKAWNSSSHSVEKLTEQLQLHVDHVKHDRSADDILYEILLKSGFPLTTKVEVQMLGKQTVYSIAGGMLLVCLEDNLTLDLIKHIAAQKPERVVCLDQGFANNDQLKANAVQIFRTKGIASFKTV